MTWNVAKDTPSVYSGPKEIPGEPLKLWSKMLFPGLGHSQGARERELFPWPLSFSKSFFIFSLLWESDIELPWWKRTNPHLFTGCSFFPLTTLCFLFVCFQLLILLTLSQKSKECIWESWIFKDRKNKQVEILGYSLRSGLCVYSTLFKHII